MSPERLRRNPIAFGSVFGDPLLPRPGVRATSPRCLISIDSKLGVLDPVTLRIGVHGAGTDIRSRAMAIQYRGTAADDFAFPSRINRPPWPRIVSEALRHSG